MVESDNYGGIMTWLLQLESPDAAVRKMGEDNL